MSSVRPVSSIRALWLITRLAGRRQANHWQSLRSGRKKNAPPVSALQSGAAAARTATPTKARGRSLFSIFVLLMMALNGFNMASGGLQRISDIVLKRVEPPFNKIQVSPYTARALAEAEAALKALQKARDAWQRRRSETLWNEEIDRLFRQEVRQQFLSDENASARLKLMHDTFAKQGASGFEGSRRTLLHTTSETWPRDGEASTVFMRVLGLMIFLWILGTVFLSLGMNNRDLGKVEWNLEWLFAFPVSARALFVSKLVEYTFLNPLAWAFFFPLLVMACFAGGHGWVSLPLGFMAFLWSLVLAGAGTTFCEVASRKFLSLTQLKNVQALATVLGAFLPLIAFAVYMSKPVDDFFAMHAASWRWLEWSPLSLPLYLALPFTTARQIEVGVFGMMAVAAIAVTAALGGSEWVTRDGLIRAAGPYQGVRKTAGAPADHGWLRGIAAHELLLLARDRNLMVQVLIVPLLLPVFYLLIFSGLTTAVAGSARHAAMLAFFIGAYAFMTSAMSILNREDKTLWYLMSFPQSIASIFLKKTLIWAAVGLVYGGATLLLVARLGHHQPGHGMDAFFALYGIALYAFIAAGIGLLATNVLETTPRERLRVDMMYLYMILAGTWANTIYAFSLWTKLAQLVVTTLLTFALWQKVIDGSPYWLDPTERPPRTVSLADGLIAVLAFFVVESVGAMILYWVAPISLSARLTLAYSFAGVMVGGLTLHYLWRQGIPGLWEKIGLTRESGCTLPQWQGVLQATAWGLVAALGAFVYLQVLKLFPEWEKWKENAELGSFLTRGENPLWLCALAILAAPIFEEFLFRGLVFKGLLRSTGPTAAVLGSAALFALVHPPVCVVPVFGLGIAAALSFRKSGLLLAPVVTHAVYNTCVVFLNK